MKTLDRRRAPGARAGFTLLELSIAGAMLLVLSIGLSESVSSLSRLSNSGGVDARLNDDAQRAASAILFDLRRSGFAVIDGRQYPHLFENGHAGAGFEAHDHAPADEHAPSGAPDHGLDREIVLRLPRFKTVKQAANGVNWDLDDPGLPTSGIVKTYVFPDLDADGDIVWSGDDVSYVLVTDAAGVNALERRATSGPTRVVARNVERVIFDSAEQAPAEVPVGAIRLRLWLRARDQRGAWHTQFFAAVSDLRNGND